MGYIGEGYHVKRVHKMCKVCGERWPNAPGGLCRRCFNVGTETWNILRESAAVRRVEAEAGPKTAQVVARLTKTVVVDGRVFEVAWDGVVRDLSPDERALVEARA